MNKAPRRQGRGILLASFLVDRSGDASYAVGQRLVTRDNDVLELVALLRKLVKGLRMLLP